MNVGELFISLGVKGSQETIAALSEIEAKLKAIGGVIPKIKIPKPHALKDSHTSKMPDPKHYGLGARYKEFSKNFQNKIKAAKKNLHDFFHTKPSDKTPKAVEEVGSGLKKISSMSLEAKAAIVGVIYALDRLFATSGAKGTKLLDLGAYLGQDTDKIQRYQYVAKIAGMSNEELASSFESLSDQMAKYRATGVPPQYWGRFQERMGSKSIADVLRYIQHPEELLQQLQTYAQIEKDIGVRNQVLDSLVGSSMAKLLIRRRFTPESLEAAPVYSEESVRRLEKSREAWARLSESVSMLFGRLNTRFGEKLGANINKLIPDIERLISSFLKLADQVHAFKGLDMMFKGWSEIFKTISNVIDYFTNLYAGKISPDQAREDASINLKASGMLAEEGVKSVQDFLITLYNRYFGNQKQIEEFKKDRDVVWDSVKNFFKENLFPDNSITPSHSGLKNPKGVAAPNIRHIGKTSDNSKIVNINQNLAFHGKHDNVREIASEFKKSVTDALLNIPLVINS